MEELELKNNFNNPTTLKSGGNQEWRATITVWLLRRKFIKGNL